MNDIAIKIENLSKQYRLGLVGSHTLKGDLQAWWYRMRGKDDPTLKIGEENKLTDAGGKYIWALKDINLEVEKGEVLGIIGKNGAGKSTLLKILSRVTGPTTGKINVNGRIASLLEVGTGFHPELTGKENIFLNGAILGMRKPEIKKKMDEIIDFAGVAKYIDTPVKRYSSGMRVRLGFAVAAFLEPEILVVDEVLAVGDAEFQKKAIGKMQDVSKGGGRTVLFVSHNMASVQSLCSRAILLKNGQIKFDSFTETVISEYINDNVSKLENKLSDRLDRKGNLAFKINEVKFLNANTKQKLDILLSGTPVLIEFNYKIHKKNIEFRNVHIAIAFDYISGKSAFVCNNKYTGELIQINQHTGKFYCKIEKWPLNLGEYIYRIHCEANNELIDRVENAGKIIVHSGDYYGSGVEVPKHLNGVLINYTWIN